MKTKPAFSAELKEPETYRAEVESLALKTTRAKGNLALVLHNYADKLYLDKFSESMMFEDWRYRINFLAKHHLEVMRYPPDDSLFLAAQMKAIELGNLEALQDLYVNNLMAISGKYKDPDMNKLERKFDTVTLKRTLKNAKALMSRWKEDQEGLAMAVEEFLGVPTGLNDCIAFAAKQLLLREKSIKATIDKVNKQKFTNDNHQNIVWINFVCALTKKRFLMSSAMRELIRIKGMKDEQEIRMELGLFAATFVRARFTNKLPDELLEFLSDYEPLSPTWFYFHMQLDKCMLACDHLPSYSDLSRQIQAQVFFENVLCARVILALRGEAAEPYKTYLPLLAFDQAKSVVLMATSANASCLDNKIMLYKKLFNEQKLTAKMTCSFFNQSLPRYMLNCATESQYRTCLPLNFIEIEKLSSTEKMQSLDDDWFMDLSDPEPKKEKTRPYWKKVNKKKTVNTTSLDLKSDVDTSSSDSASVAKIEVDKVSKEPTIPQQEVEAEIDDPVDEPVDEIEEYLAEHQAEVFEFKAMKSMKRYQFDALRDASKSLGIAEPPKQLHIKKTSVVFFSTDDFLALHPDAAHVYQLNVYSELANAALAQPKIKLQWIFSKDVVIGQDTFIFLCQVFNLVEGRSKLTFDDFVKAVDALTNPAIGTKNRSNKEPNRTVFRFTHAFVINGEICLPPIGGVHREHASSRFNYKQVKKFLMHGGAHPYFFQVLEQEPNKK